MEAGEPGILPFDTTAEEYMDNENIIIKEKTYPLFLDKDEYKLIMSINNLKEIIFSLTQINSYTPYYYESTYSLQKINDISKLLNKKNIEDIFNYYNEELFTKKKVKLSAPEKKEYIYLNYIIVVNNKENICKLELTKKISEERVLICNEIEKMKGETNQDKQKLDIKYKIIKNGLDSSKIKIEDLKKEIELLKKTNENKINDIKNEYEKEINNLKNEIKMLKENFENNINQMKKEEEIKANKMKEELIEIVHSMILNENEKKNKENNELSNEDEDVNLALNDENSKEFLNKGGYKYEIISKNFEKDLSREITEFIDEEVNFTIMLKNICNLKWPGEEKTKLINDKKSDIKANDIILKSLGKDECQKINITLKVGNLLASTNRQCVLNFNVDGVNYGNPLILMINVKKHQDHDKVVRFREDYYIPPNFSYKTLLEILEKTNYDYAKAFELLFSYLKK